MDALLNCYRVPELNGDCLIYGIAGEGVKHSRELEILNRQLKKKQMNAVCIPLDSIELDELLAILEDLNISGIQLGNPLKEIAIEKFSRIDSFPDMPVFLKISYLNGNPEINMYSISAEKFFESF